MPQLTIKTQNCARTISVQAGENLYEAIVRAGVNIDAPCGGKCLCGKCRVKTDGAPSIEEQRFLSDTDLQNGVRLACAMIIEGDIEVIVEGKRDARILADEGNVVGEVDPAILRLPLDIAPPSLDDQRADDVRLLGAIDAHLDRAALSLISDGIRQKNVEARVINGMVIDICPPDQPIYGVAVDIGTTTMVAYLVDMITGKQLAHAGALNPQRPHGADVISRTEFGVAGGIERLAELVRNEITRLIDELAEKSGVKIENICQILPVGNTIMMHMLLGLPTKYIAAIPFTPVYTRGFTLRANEINLKPTRAAVTIPPCVAGYVGADTLGAIISSDMDQSSEISLLIDIGTNGEIVLGNRDRLTCCSAAAGPAFEGAHIRCGTGGVAGAVDSVRMNEADGVTYTTIDGAAAHGICGSGLVDAVAALKAHEIIDMMGKMDANPAEGALKDAMFTLDNKPALRITGDVCICQRDIREVQLAKGAIAAGVDVLMKHMRIGFKDIARLYLAGGFGNYIDKNAACDIGLLPPELREVIIPIGNGAGAGARNMLLSRKNYARAEQIAQNMEYIELSGRADFQDLFVDRMLFE